MKKNVTFKLAASTLVLGLTAVGCSPGGSNYRPTSASAKPAKSEAEAAKVYAQAQAAVAAGNVAGALTIAERAVELSPRDAGYRTLLGDLYIKNGRFVSAEAAFADVLTLNPGDVRATLSIALSQVAQGKTQQALEHLNSVVASAPADAGLAYALAGQPQRAIDVLESAARAPGANGRVRQNLALAYAIAGDWQKARVTASQDLSPDEVGQRMQQWAAFTNPATAYLQVAKLLGVNQVQDQGQPVRLALAPAVPEQPVYAEAEVPAPTAVEQAPVAVAEAPAPAPVAAPVEVASAQKVESFSYTPPEHGDAFKIPATVAVVDVPASLASEPAKTISGTQFAAAVTSLVKSPEPILKAISAQAKVAPTPVRAFVPQKAAKKARSSSGRFVVQIGAYRNAVQVEKAWANAVRRYRFGNEPMSTTVTIPGKGTFHRLAVSGFETAAQAARTCQLIRGKGGTCFVRANAGDAPVKWASRYTRNA